MHTDEQNRQSGEPPDQIVEDAEGLRVAIMDAEIATTSAPVRAIAAIASNKAA